MKTNDLRWVSLHFINIDGGLHHRTIAAKDLTEASFSDGIETDLTEVFGFTGKALSLVPDPDSFAKVPWEPNTMRLLCDIYSIPGKERSMKDSRYSVERININAKAMGITDVQIGAESEFYLFDNVTGDKLSPERGPNFLIDSREAYWNPTPFWNTRKGAYASQPQDTFYSARVQIAEIVEDHFRYGVASHSHGRSANGQQRVSLRETNAKLAADALVSLKHVARNIAYISSSIATFMPLPVANEKGSALNLSQKLRKGTANLFYDEKGEYAQLSQTALYYIGGILEHAEALCVFTAPTTNSYKRLKNDPRYAAWSRSSPNALVCVNSAVPDPERSIIYTGADPSVNPYLAYAAVVAAGLDGIKNKIDPGKPVDENLLAMDAKRRKELKVKSLPSSVMDAVAALENDNKFLKGFISTEILAEYLEQRLEEHKENEKRPTAYEIEKYFWK